MKNLPEIITVPNGFSAYNPGHDQWLVCPQIKQGYHRIILLTLTCDLFKINALCSSWNIEYKIDKKYSKLYVHKSENLNMTDFFLGSLSFYFLATWVPIKKSVRNPAVNNNEQSCHSYKLFRYIKEEEQ